MTYIIIKYGEDRLVANADCLAGVLLNFLLERMSAEHLEPEVDWTLDLCDGAGALQLLSSLPPATRALDVITPHRTYSALARRSAQPDGMFQLVGGGQLSDDQVDRMARAELALELALARLDPAESESDAPVAGSLTQLVMEARRGDLTDAALRARLARLPREARSERVAALEARVQLLHVGQLFRAGQLAGRLSRMGPKKRAAARSKSSMSQKSTASRASSKSHT